MFSDIQKRENELLVPAGLTLDDNQGPELLALASGSGTKEQVDFPRMGVNQTQTKKTVCKVCCLNGISQNGLFITISGLGDIPALCQVRRLQILVS